MDNFKLDCYGTPSKQPEMKLAKCQTRTMARRSTTGALLRWVDAVSEYALYGTL